MPDIASSRFQAIDSHRVTLVKSILVFCVIQTSAFRHSALVVIEELSLTGSSGSLDYYREMTRAALLLFEILLSNGQTPPGAYSRIRSLASIYAYTRVFFLTH